jgi:putative hydrolase of the HAD superfamily
MNRPGTLRSKASALHALDEEAALGKLDRVSFIKKASSLLQISPDDIEQQFFHSSDINKELIDFILKVRKKYKVSLLSNIGGDMMDGFFTATQLKQLFNDVILSGNIKLAKPDPEIFKLACKRLDVDPEETVMVDDIQGNVNAAKTLGMQGICYKDFKHFKQEWDYLSRIDFK